MLNTQQLTPTILPANAANRDIVYSSSNPAVATVSSSGLVTGVAVGIVTITITAADGSGVSTSVSVTVTPIKVASISADPSSISALFLGSEQQLTPAILPANAANKEITYSSSNSGVATVSASGLVTGVALGTANVVISASDGSGVTSSIPVTVIPIKVASISASPSSIPSILIGSTQQLTPSILPANATNQAISYSSSNTGVATVSASGLVTGVSVGSVTITILANDGSGVSTTVSVKVDPVKVADITTSPISPIRMGTTQQIISTISPINATNKEVTYSSSDTEVATVSSSGLVTGVSVGSATITINAADGSGVKKLVDVSVLLPIYVDSISADYIIDLPMGSTQQITPTILPADATNRVVTYSSSDNDIATVSSSGLVTGVAIGGPVIITISATDGSDVKTDIEVIIGHIDVTSIVASPSSITNLFIDGTQQITASVLPVNATNQVLTYSSYDPSIADVDETGLVTGISVGGPVDIIISSTDDSAVTRRVPVTVLPIKVTGLLADPIEIPFLTINDTHIISYTAFPYNAANTDVTYSSSNPNIAIVDESGLVTGISVGSVMITLAATDGSGVSTSVSVTITPIYVSNIMADPTNITLVEEDIAQVTYTVLPEDATNSNVTYSSSDNDIATVNEDGLVTAVAQGDAMITLSATDNSGVYTRIPIKVNATKVTSIVPSPLNIQSLNVGLTQQIRHTVLPSNANNKAVTYSSSNAAIATVTSTGLVKGIALGFANITLIATDGSGITADVPVKITATLVTSITSAPASITYLRIGNTQKLTPTILPFTATNKSLVYTSSDKTIATVSSSGIVTGVSVGSVMITLAATDGSGVSKIVPVSVEPILVTGIKLSPSAVPFFRVGGTQQLTPTVLPSYATNMNVTYSSSDITKVTVSPTGLLTGLALGNVTITISATDGSNVSSTIPVKVIPILATSIRSSPISIASLGVGLTRQLTPTIFPANATSKAVTYSSSNTKFATVSSTGLVTGVAKGGPVNIMITAADGSRKAVAVPVIVVPTLVKSITSSPVSVPTLGVGLTQQLTPTIFPANADNKAVTYSSSNTKIATVSPAGLITALAIGGPINIIISAKDGSKIARTVPVTVVPILVNSITSSPISIASLGVGLTQQLTPTVLPLNAGNKAVTYSSSNAAIARVSPTGLVTGVALGTTNVVISASDASGIERTVSVTVTSIKVNNIIGISILALPVGTSQKITPTILPANATNKAVSYTSSSKSIVIVNPNGIVTGISAGTAYITIAARDGSNVNRIVSVTVVRQ
jgi:uncharacterized protein YjdB